MIGLIQRVHNAQVEVNEQIIASIGQGILLSLAIEKDDTYQKAQTLLDKIVHYRIFADETGKMNLNVQQIKASILIVSQFTLAANTQKGTRPSFSQACPPAMAQQLYDFFVAESTKIVATQTGIFATDMQVKLTNNGPVTFWLQV